MGERAGSDLKFCCDVQAHFADLKYRPPDDRYTFWIHVIIRLSARAIAGQQCAGTVTFSPAGCIQINACAVRNRCFSQQSLDARENLHEFL
jgi:hypothetical protein